MGSKIPTVRKEEKMTTENLKPLNIRNVAPETHRKLRLLAAVLNITQPQALEAAVSLALKEQDSLIKHQLNKDLK